MGDAQRLSPEEQIEVRARGSSRAGTDFTVAVEEEFALLDPATLDLVNQFEDVQAAAVATPLEPDLVGELIASEAEVKTGRCESFAQIPARMAQRRAALQARRAARPDPSARPARIPGPTGRTSGSSIRPTIGETTSCSATSSGATTPSASTSTSASAGLTGRSPSRTGSATSCPSSSRSPPARRSWRASNTGLHSARTQIFTRFFPRCGVPDAFASLAAVRGLRPLPLRDRLGHRAHAALVERAPAPRLPDGRDPDLRTASPTSPRRSRSPPSAPRSPRGSPARTTRASRSPTSRTA